MKKDVILEALKNVGIELDEEKTKDFVSAINKANDLDIQKFKDEQADIQNKLNELQMKYDNDIKAKDEELSKFDVKEIDELRKYKSDNEIKIKEDKQLLSLKNFLAENKYSSDNILLNFVMNKLSPEFNDDNQITNPEILLGELESNAKQYKISQTTGGAEATNINKNEKSAPVDPFLEGWHKNDKK